MNRPKALESFDQQAFWEGNGTMIKGSCHCGAVKFELNDEPEWLTRCNCSYCRRAGWLLAHTEVAKVELDYAPGDVIKYIHGDKMLYFVSCKHCGCTTHWEGLDLEPTSRMAVNVLMAPPEEIDGIRVRHFDGADSWKFLD